MRPTGTETWKTSPIRQPGGKNGSQIFAEIVKRGEEWAGRVQEYLQSHPIREFLLWLNLPENWKTNHRMYMHLACVGSREEPAGAMWTARYWYYPNPLIYKNLTELIRSNGERIFVLYGAGHLYLLHQFLQESGTLAVEPAEKYLRGR